MADGGHGGWGGGGGGGYNAGQAGFGGGGGSGSNGSSSAAQHRGGGGGLGAGGDIFVQAGGTLTIEGGDLAAGTVAGGASGGHGAGGGAAYGDGLFIGNNGLTLAGTSGGPLIIAGAIADQGSGTTNGAGNLTISSGTVEFTNPNASGSPVNNNNAPNSYHGATYVYGTLEVEVGADLGDSGELRTFNGSTFEVLSTTTVSSAIITTDTTTIGAASGATGTFTGNIYAQGPLAIGGSGTVVLDNGTNLFTGGGMTIESGALEIAASGAAGGVSITLDANTKLKVDNAALGGSGNTLTFTGDTINGFAIGDVVDLTGAAFNSPSTPTVSGGLLQFSENGETYQIQFNSSQSFSGERFSLTSDGGSGTDIKLQTVASPTLTTTPSPTTVTLSNATPAKLTDSATLSGGSSPTGTITFTLYQGSTLVDTETVTVTGNGTYTTPTGYTLPTSRYGDRHLPVGRQLQRRHQQQRRQRQQRCQRAGDGQRGQPDDHHDPQPDHGHAGHDVR